MGRNNKDKKEEEEEGEKKIKINIASDAKRSTIAIILFALAVLFTLGFFGSGGVVGKSLNEMAGLTIGWAKLIFPLFLVIAGIILLLRKETIFYVTKIIGLTIVLFSLTGIFHWFFNFHDILAVAKVGRGGGYAGYIIAYILEKYLGGAGSLVVLLAFLFIGFIVAFDFSIINFFAKFKKEKVQDELTETEESKKINEDEELDDGDDDKEEELNQEKQPKNSELKKTEQDSLQETENLESNIKKIEFVEGNDQFVDPSLEVHNEISSRELENYEADEIEDAIEDEREEDQFIRKNKKQKWTLPPLELLEESMGEAKGGDVERNFSIIEKTLKDFGIEVERGEAQTGPTVTQYSFRPAVGVKISKILALQNDLSLALAEHPIRIEAPIPGKSLIGIEVPNKVSSVVRLKNILAEKKFKKRKSNLILALGEDVSGTRIFDDLAKMPHLMIAGATGTGKSVATNVIITTLLYQNSPEDLKFIMVDPKMVELSVYNGIPHLLTEVIVENSKVINALKWAVREMEKRYKLLQETGSRDLVSYEEKRKTGFTVKHTNSETGEISEEKLKKIPYIIIVIDELADLMISHGKEVEGAIVRIAQMARAVGIHLIVSTQRPSVEVITGLIKANIPTRIAFKVATQIDSRTIIDMGGADKLLGNGDSLFLSSHSPKPARIQGIFVSEVEVKRVVEFIKKQQEAREEKNEDDEEEKKDITENTQKEILEFQGTEPGKDDELIEQAKREIIRAKKASATLLQTRLSIGYSRASRIINVLEDQGFVGPSNGSKPREIYGLNSESNVEYQDDINDQVRRDKWQI